MQGRRIAVTAGLLVLVVVALWFGLLREEPAETPGAGPGLLAQRAGDPPATRPELPAVMAEGGPAPTALAPVAESLAAEAAVPATEPPLLRLVARVVRTDGAPVPGASAALAWSLNDNPTRFITQAQSAADGRVALEVATEAGSPPGREAWVVVHHAGCDLAARRVTDLRPGEHDLGDILLPGGAGLRGRAVAPDGTPRANAHVRVEALSPAVGGRGPPERDADLDDLDEPTSRALQRLRQVMTGADGTFAFAGLPAGAARLEVDAAGALVVRLDGLTLSAGRTLDVGDVRLEGGLAIAGVVVTSAGEPLPQQNVRVQRQRHQAPDRRDGVEREGQRLANAHTDEQGRFRVEGLAPGLHDLVVSARGQAFSVFTAQAGDEDVRFELLDPAVVLLELRDARTDQPVMEATLDTQAQRVMADGSTYGTSANVATTHGADAGLPPGTFRVSGLGAEGAVILVEAPGHAPGRLDVPPLAPGQTWLARLRLDRALRLRGVVVGPRAEPVEGATVQVAPQSGPALGSATRRATSDAQGAFAFEGLASGTWQLWAYAPECVSKVSTQVEFGQEDVEGLALRLLPGASLTGTALTARGDAVPGTRVVAWLVRAAPVAELPVADAILVAEPQPGSPSASATVEPDGTFRLGPLTPGEHLVTAALPADKDAAARLRLLAEAEPGPAGLPPGVERVAVVAGEERRLDLLLPRPATLLGRVAAGGVAVPGAQVALLAGEGEEWVLVASTETDAGGAFALRDLPALEGAVVAGAAGEVLPRARRVSLREGDTQSVEVAFDGPALAGTVVDALSSQPVAGVTVSAWLEAPAEGQGDTIRSLGPTAWGAARPAGIDAPGATTDGAGRFRIVHVAGGRWRLYAGGNGWLSAGQAQVEVDSDWTPDEVTLLVKAGAVVEGSARWELAGPAGPEVIVELHSPSRGGSAGWVHASDGAYRIAGLAPGEYELRVRHMVPGGSQIHSQALALQEGERRRIDLELRP